MLFLPHENHICFFISFAVCSIRMSAQIEDSTTFNLVEAMPVFPGGEKAMYVWLGENIKYPKDAVKDGIEGKVYVQFIVERDGSVSNIKIARGLSESIDKEAMRAVASMPLWSPGIQEGKPVRVSYTLPILFKLQKKKKKN